MASIFDVEPPRWLQEIAKPIDAGKTGQFMGLLLAGATRSARDDSGNTSFTEGFNEARMTLADPNWKLKMAQAEMKTLSEMARAESAWQRMAVGAQEEAAWLQDLPLLAEHSAKPLEQQLTEPLGGLKSKRGNAMAIQQNRAASSSAVAKAMQDSKSDYDKRIAEIVKEAPDIGSGLALQPNQFPRPNNWEALEIAEQRVALRRKIQGDSAAFEAEQRGDQVTTTIDEQGKVSKTYRPGGTTVMPQEATLSDGTAIVYNPKSGHFVVKKGDREKELSATQLGAIAKEIRTTDPENAKLINDFLTQQAKEQISSKPATGSKGGIGWSDFQSWRSKQ